MCPQLAPSWDKLDRRTQRLTSALNKLPPPDLTRRPAANAWSALEILDHLIKVEQCLLDDLEPNLSRSIPVQPLERVRARAVVAVMLSRVRVTVPATAHRVLPQPEGTLPQLLDAWSTLRSRLSARVSALAPEQLSLGVMRHPVSGWLDTKMALNFLSSHLQHHTYQLNRLPTELSHS